MKLNMGMTDRVLRIIFAGLFVAGFTSGVIPGVWGYIAFAAALIFALTGLVGWCPLYVPFGISTLGKEETN